MTKKKNGLLTLLFSLVPGAGEMYMGFMKQGGQHYVGILDIDFFGGILKYQAVLFMLPILWCYSFFNVHNIRGMSDDEFYALEDDYLFHLDKIFPMERWSRKQNNILAAVLIIIGVAMLWDYITDYLMWLIPDKIYWNVVHSVPQVCVSLLLIVGGLYLIRGKKKELDQKEEQEEWMK